MGDQVGDVVEIVMSYETSQEGSDGSSSSSQGTDVLSERVIAVTDDGIELEFDLPPATTAEERTRVWQYPARVLRGVDGEKQLLNPEELEVRLDAWLALTEWDRNVCGQWIFTWNAFLIECDPQSVLETIDAIDMRGVDLRDGAQYRHPGASETGAFTRSVAPDGETVFVVELGADIESVRKSRAESDVVIGEISGQPVTLEEALIERSREDVSGTVEVSFQGDAQGVPTRRVVVTNLKTISPDGVVTTERETRVLERRRVAGAPMVQ
ncbi:hypothetical protein [Brevundimonas lutea]|uniref:hypothetical protein n=1 Tax=Brevundimonas lutea TaxID=2293980 RepID=UPI0013CF0F95|nr:hypothetical protein [Brevundimonas lutea]